MIGAILGCVLCALTRSPDTLASPFLTLVGYGLVGLLSERGLRSFLTE